MKHLNSGFVTTERSTLCSSHAVEEFRTCQDRANHEQEQWGTVKKKKQVKAGRALSDKVDKVHMVAEDSNLNGKTECKLIMDVNKQILLLVFVIACILPCQTSRKRKR